MPFVCFQDVLVIIALSEAPSVPEPINTNVCKCLPQLSSPVAASVNAMHPAATSKVAVTALQAAEMLSACMKLVLRTTIEVPPAEKRRLSKV